MKMLTDGELVELLQKAALLGWDESAEGMNAEYVDEGSPEDYGDWVSRKIALKLLDKLNSLQGE